jgi:hypothetical protein
MNVERLHAIALALREDLRQTRIVEELGTLGGALQNLAQQAGQPQYQDAVSAARETVRRALSLSAVDRWPSTWQETLEELGLRGRLGADLLASVENAFSENEITPQTAATRINDLAAQLTADQDNIQKLLDAFAAFSIGAEALASDEAEVMISIPRAEVHENLPDLGKEFRELDKDPWPI